MHRTIPLYSGMWLKEIRFLFHNLIISSIHSFGPFVLRNRERLLPNDILVRAILSCRIRMSDAGILDTQFLDGGIWPVGSRSRKRDREKGESFWWPQNLQLWRFHRDIVILAALIDQWHDATSQPLFPPQEPPNLPEAFAQTYLRYSACKAFSPPSNAFRLLVYQSKTTHKSQEILRPSNHLPRKSCCFGTFAVGFRAMPLKHKYELVRTHTFYHLDV